MALLLPTYTENLGRRLDPSNSIPIDSQNIEVMKKIQKPRHKTPMQIKIRPATVEDCDALGIVTVTASMKTFLGNIPEESFDFSWTPEMSAANWRDFFNETLPPQELFVVAEVGPRVVGYIRAGRETGRNDYQRFVDALYILPSMQRRGVGRALLRHVANWLRERGINSLLIGCVKENPSCSFYRHIGGIEVYRKPNTVDNYSTEEIFFGWSDLTEMAKAKRE